MSTCSCGGCGCSTCQPARSIFQGECADPGTLTVGRFLSVLDYKFCERRLATGSGFLVSNINGSGNASLTWTETPQVALSEYLATENQVFGNLVVMGSDSRWRYLQGPSSLGLYLQTDANGMLFFGDPPTATVPDPLAINDLSVANEATINDLTTNGTVTLNNIASGTVVNLLGLDVSNEVVLQSLAAGVAACMFYEAPTSPSPSTPNATKTNGQNLVIGNRLFDSGANLIAVTTSEAITVNVTGKYMLAWVGLCDLPQNSKAAISLMVNNVMVNNAGRTDITAIISSAASAIGTFVGFEVRSLTAGDVLNLQLNINATAVATYNVRLIAIKFAD